MTARSTLFPGLPSSGWVPSCLPKDKQSGFRLSISRVVVVVVVVVVAVGFVCLFVFMSALVYTGYVNNKSTSKLV